MTIYFAWVDLIDDAAPPFSEVHHVEDEDVFGFEITHSEGDFPQLSLEVKNPNGALLSPGRKRWAWLSRDVGGTVTPLFFGRLVGMPEGIGEETFRLLFIARRKNWLAQKAALADSLRVLPYYDPAWIAEELRSDLDIVLQARSALWHTDRVTGAMTISDYLVGEDGTAVLDHFKDGFDVRFVTNAAQKVNISAEAVWEQEAGGEVDITSAIVSAFGGNISSFTGEGLVNSWPQPDTRIGGGWRVGRSSASRRGGSASFINVYTNSLDVGRFPRWNISANMSLIFDVRRSYSERVTMSVQSAIQPLIVNVDEEEPIEINLATSSVGEPVNGVIPIGSLERRSYFQTDRGEQTISYLLERARAVLRAEARAVEVQADISFEQAAALSCRKNATVIDYRLPGGSATGKVAEYSFGIDGNSGSAFGRVNIGCTIGDGSGITAPAPAPSYVEEGYVDAGWQLNLQSTTVLPDGDGGWIWDDRTINDDGGALPGSVVGGASGGSIATIEVTNSASQQAALVGQGPFENLAEAASILNANFTRVKLTIDPITTSGFNTTYQIEALPIALPKTIDLEAV